MSLVSRIRRIGPALVGLYSVLGLAPAQVTQIRKLVGAGAVGPAEQGYSVGLSADGNIAIVGGQSDNLFVGAAWIFRRIDGEWQQSGAKLIGSGYEGRIPLQGSSVGLSADGNTAIVGGIGDRDYVGAAWIFARSGTRWEQQGSKLVGTAAVGQSLQGVSVALSADGNTAIVGGHGDNRGIGAAWVFTRSAGEWRQQAKLFAEGVTGNVRQGVSVALSADGNTALIGGPGGSAAWVYLRTGGTWKEQRKLVGISGPNTRPSSQGASVALSADGDTAIVGGPTTQTGGPVTGAAWVFSHSSGVWNQQGSNLVGTGWAGLSNQGSSVALSRSGDVALVGAAGDSGSGTGTGAAWIYRRKDGIWSQQGGKIVGSGVLGGVAYQGKSVALSEDGTVAILGGHGDDAKAGAAWVFSVSAPPAPVTPVIATNGVVNGASFLPEIAPGAWVTIRGSNLSVTTRTWNSFDFPLASRNLPTQLDCVSVSINGKPASVYFISPSQLNVLAPDESSLGPASVQVAITPLVTWLVQGNSNVVTVSETALSPALFTFGNECTKYVAAVRVDRAYIAPPNCVTGATTAPAKPGDTILLFGTGFGPTTPPTQSGRIVDPAPLTNQVSIRIGELVAEQSFAGIVAPGLYQFNVVIPNVGDGDNAVRAEINGRHSQTNAFLYVQR